MKRLHFIFLTSLLICLSRGFLLTATGQGIGINPTGTNPDPSAMLDVSSTTKGTLITRMTTAQRNAISNPATGLQIYNTTTNCFEFFAYGVWQTIVCATCPIPAAPTSGTHVPSTNQIVWNWNTVSGASGYKWNTTNNYLSATDNGASTTYTQTGLICNTAYTLYVWAYNVCGNNSPAATLTQTTSTSPTCFVAATGGTVTTDGNYKVHTFTTNGTFTVTAAGDVEYLVVGGGGGGGYDDGGGGGAGGFRTATGFPVTVQSYSITVGGGGAGGTTTSATGTNGTASFFSTISSAGGGGGGSASVSFASGANGGSGGGVRDLGGTTTWTPGTGIPGQGNDGGADGGGSSNQCGSGGGGAGAIGAVSGTNIGGNGGVGLSSAISGSLIFYAGGGGGGAEGSPGTPGSGGNGGGASGGGPNNAGSNATVSTGAGGGGGSGGSVRTGGNGGSGIVIIRYRFQ